MLTNRHQVLAKQPQPTPTANLAVPEMNTQTSFELPPADFVAFLAQRTGLSQAAAEDRLERWFGEYHRQTSAAPGGHEFQKQAPRGF